MKTAEEHLYDAFNDGFGEPQTLEDFVSKLKAHPYYAPLIKAMQLYSDEQNKELREEKKELTEAFNSLDDAYRKKIESLTKENNDHKNVMTTLCQMIDGKNAAIEELKTFLKEAYARP